MGLQQILMIVLGVLIVGVAVTVGIVMFGNQAYNSNRTALIAEMTYFSSIAIQYWKLPVSLGGAGQSVNSVSLEALAAFMGFSSDANKVVSLVFSYKSDNGECRVNYEDGIVKFTGLGNESKKGLYPFIHLDLNLVTGATTVTVEAAESFEVE